MDDRNSLSHYGVLGMKWGIRKARKQGKQYKAKGSFGTQYLERKLAKAKAAGKPFKAANLQTRLDASKERDARKLSLAKNVSAGRYIASRTLNGAAGVVSFGLLRGAGFSTSMAGMVAGLTVMRSNAYADRAFEREIREKKK